MTDTSLAAQIVEQLTAGMNEPVERFDDGSVATLVESRHGAWVLLVRPVADDEVVVIESLAPLLVPQAKFRVVAELLALVNDELLLGTFVIEQETGRVRMRMAVDVEALSQGVADPVSVGVAMLSSPVITNIASMDRWLTALSVVVNGDTVPADAVALTHQRP